jgi:hypothetical protein
MRLDEGDARTGVAVLGWAAGFRRNGTRNATRNSHLCQFDIFHIIAIPPIVLDGSGPGDGDLSLSFGLLATMGTGVL